MDIAALFGILLALVALAITVTPKIQNWRTAFIAWGLTVLYAAWFYSTRSSDINKFVVDHLRVTLAAAVAIGLLIAFWCVGVLRARHVSITGADGYLFRFTDNDRHFVIADDVTLTNHRTDVPVSIGAEFVVIEEVEMASTNTPNGPTEMYRHECSFKPETHPIQKWETARLFKRNRPLEFPLRLGPGETKRGYVGFCVWQKIGPKWDLPPSRNSGTLVFTDYTAKKVLKRSHKDSRRFLVGI